MNNKMKIIMAVLGVLAIGFFIAGGVMISHNSKIHNFNDKKETYTASDVIISSNVNEALKNDEIVIDEATFRPFVEKYTKETGMPVILQFVTTKDLGIKPEDDFEKYCDDNYLKFTDNNQDCLCIVACADDANNLKVTFATGKYVHIDWTAVDEFQSKLNTKITANNYKFTTKMLVDCLNDFETKTFVDMNNNPGDREGGYIAVFNDSTKITPEELSHIYPQFVNKDENIHLNVDYQIYYYSAKDVISKTLIIAMFVLGFVCLVTDIFMGIKFYGENKGVK